MDILLCHSYFLSQDPAEQKVMKPYPPLGLLYISSYLKAQGMDVGLCDTTFSDYDSVRAKITGARPFAVGIYTNLMTRRHVLAIMAMARDVGARIILGGPEATNYREEYFARGADVIVVGEGEETLAELIPHMRSRGMTGLEAIRGIVFRREDGSIAATPGRALNRDLDARPFPDRAAIDLERYISTWETHHGVRSVSLITARGCPYQCQWCSHSVFGISYRHRSPENVIEELREIRDTYRPDQVWYADDVFTMNFRWLDRFADLLEDNGMHYPFESISREDRLTEDVIRTLKRMGCYRLWIGAESGSQRILDSMRRRTDAARMREMIEMVQDHGIRAGTFIMVGYEGETAGDIAATVRHLKAAPPDDVLTTVAYPIKGTPYYDQVADRLVAPRDWSESTERDARIRGRRSRGYFAAAEAWIGAEVELSRIRRGMSSASVTRVPRLWLSAQKHRLSMWRRAGEVEA
ncbi:B12-binding domain-containing radical SAM protein [Pseudooceanicola sp.]|uniref:B12-binding domain-containing radical SAM protein n=1 Tax=Pseudooceanicola sp. TaxID=1914328 RepID=UPI0035C6DD30